MARDGPRIVVFLGPTLRFTEAEAALPAIYVRPAAQGDVILAAHAYHPQAMIMIDGQFEDRPAVRHKEILWAMAQGITMIGAASMGALRAAELHPFGMIGVGVVYRWYRRFPLAPDDAVAIHSGPAELGFPPLTDALVDLLATFSALSRRGAISRADRLRLAREARATNFRDRSLAAILEKDGSSKEAISRFRAQMVERKRRDALMALNFAARLFSAARAPVVRRFEVTNTFIRDLEAGGIDPALLYNYSHAQ